MTEQMKNTTKKKNWTILDGNMINKSLIIMEGTYCAIGADHSSCHGYWRVPDQDALFDLILWYVAKTIYLS